MRHGVIDNQGRATGDSTCTACAGTMLLEFGALSRLTADPIYEVSNIDIVVLEKLIINYY